MNNEAPVDPVAPLSTDVADAADLADPGAVREVFRARNRLSVGVMERPHPYHVSYSLRDIHRLTFLSHEERTAAKTDWHAWHRTYVRLGTVGVCLWLLGIAIAVACWYATSTLASASNATLGFAIPTVWFKVLGSMVAASLLVTLPAFLATVAARALCESYLRGYADGLTRGVNRALQITPEMEHEMWEELRQAETLDARWRRVTDSPGEK